MHAGMTPPLLRVALLSLAFYPIACNFTIAKQFLPLMILCLVK